MASLRGPLKGLRISGPQNSEPTGASEYIIQSHISNDDYVRLLKSSDAFVLPTRGEGWGMPVSEAMSMGLPVIVTNWSGTAAFVDNSVGYLINYALSQVPDDQPEWLRAGRWADADVMRYVFNNPGDAAEKGKLARRRMVDHYSPAATGRILAQESPETRGNYFGTQYVATVKSKVKIAKAPKPPKAPIPSWIGKRESRHQKRRSSRPPVSLAALVALRLKGTSQECNAIEKMMPTHPKHMLHVLLPTCHSHP
eukprot:gene1503-32881_t